MSAAIEALERLGAALLPSDRSERLADIAAVQAALLRGTEAVEVLRAWGEARAVRGRRRSTTDAALRCVALADRLALTTDTTAPKGE